MFLICDTNFVRFIKDNNKMYYGQAADKMAELCEGVRALEPKGGAKSGSVAIKMEEVEVESKYFYSKILKFKMPMEYQVLPSEKLSLACKKSTF